VNGFAAVLGTIMALASPAPSTTITSGPVGNSGLGVPRFEFGADGAASFECSLDDAPYAACASPQTVGPLVSGSHTFAVRAIDAAGNVEPTPAVRKWTYIASPLSSATITLGHPARAAFPLAKFTTISGKASSASRVSRVLVALQTGNPDKNRFPPACNFFDMRSGIRVIRPCLLPAYQTVRGTSAWTYKVPAAVRGRLKPGRYTLIVRAFNAFNQATRRDYILTLR
jgi:hypothetical protein